MKSNRWKAGVKMENQWRYSIFTDCSYIETYRKRDLKKFSFNPLGINVNRSMARMKMSLKTRHMKTMESDTR